MSRSRREYLLCPRKPYEKVCFAGVSLMSRPIDNDIVQRSLKLKTHWKICTRDTTDYKYYCARQKR